MRNSRPQQSTCSVGRCGGHAELFCHRKQANRVIDVFLEHLRHEDSIKVFAKLGQILRGQLGRGDDPRENLVVASRRRGARTNSLDETLP